jgi:hypothetical protein
MRTLSGAVLVVVMALGAGGVGCSDGDAGGPFVRFVACADGVTVEDNVTGLLWERKMTTGDVHDVSNTYTWSARRPPQPAQPQTARLRPCSCRI